jgi:putative MATE family efflux protein
MSNSALHIKLQVDISYRQILRMSLPIAASFIVPQINFITNNIFLGGLGEQPLAVAGITGVYYLIFGVIGLGLNNGLQALIARRAGENRIEEIGNLFHQGVRIGLLIALAGIIVTYFIAPTVLNWSLHTESNVQMAVDFLFIRIWGLPILYVYQMRNALLVGINQTRYLVIGTLAETIANIVLDYGLIYGHFGLPAMGFNGAAVASIIAEATGLVTIFAVMRSKGISKHLQLFKKYAYDAVNTKLILVQSSPLILQHAISICSWLFFYILIEHHGERDLAISNTMRNIFGLFGCVTWSFAATANAMVSNVIGQGLEHRVIELIHKIIRMSVSFAVVVCLLLNLIPEIFLSIYQQGDDFIIHAIPVLRVVSTALILMSVSTVWLNAVVGTGNSKMNLFSESISIVFYCIYIYVVLELMQLPITIGWASEWLYWICLFIPSFWYLKSGRWKGRKI